MTTSTESSRSHRIFGGLSTIEIDTEYRSKKDDPVGRFYRPCLLHSLSYKRAVGYFRSTVFLVTGHSVTEFAKRGGKLYLICSPHLDHNDIDAIALGYARRSEQITRSIIEQFNSMLDDTHTSYAARVLATLISVGTLEIKLAVRADRKGLYHEKIGIFSDEMGNSVSFKGSTNETWSGWHDDGNIESIEVFCDWRGGLEAERVRKHQTHFDMLWSESDPDIEVFKFPTEAVEHLKKSAFGDLDQMRHSEVPVPAVRRSAMAHQHAAVIAWEAAGFRGVFQHATGSGKTFTAILVIQKHAALGLPSIVVVPSQLLLEQWATEIRDEIPNAALLLAGAGHNRWRIPGRLRSMTDPDPDLGGRIVLATMQTASSKEFCDAVRSGEHLLLVADEVHQTGSPMNSMLMNIDAHKRLGLSATPIRYGDPEGTESIFRYFGNVIQPAITLNDAIRAGRLVPYEYFPHLINLTATEADEWRDVTRAIQLDMARQRPDEFGNRVMSDRVKMLLIKRSRIAKKASAKVRLTVDVLLSSYVSGQSWLIYCEDSSQLAEVLFALRREGLNPVEYHSNMDGDKNATMAWFKQFGGILVSVRCLDEGVDIPAVSHALILASSQNPRQFIQRRGRVLRKAEGKQIAVVHDAVVVPLSMEKEPEQSSLLRAELLRAVEFADNALNLSASAELREVALRLGINPETFTGNLDTEDEEQP